MEYEEFSSSVEANAKLTAMYGKFAMVVTECINKLSSIMDEASKAASEAESNVTNLMTANREFAKRWVAESVESGKFQELFAHERLQVTKKGDGVYDVTWAEEKN